jgi:hypothetical protein
MSDSVKLAASENARVKSSAIVNVSCHRVLANPAVHGQSVTPGRIVRNMTSPKAAMPDHHGEAVKILGA